ncbi:MAG: glycosyltransferase family 4 protein [Sandaracinaceae bacterium]
MTSRERGGGGLAPGRRGPDRPGRRVLHVCAIDDSLRLVLGRQLQYLRDRGYEVHAACSRGPGADDLARQLGVPIHHVPISRRIEPGADAQALWALVSLLREQRYDLVHLHFPKSSLLGATAARLARVPLVVQTVRPMFMPHMPLGRRQLLMTIERYTCSLCTHLLAQNPDDALYYPEQWVCPPSKISAIGNGIELARFDPARPEHRPSAARRELGLPDDAFVIGMAGRYTVEKGYREFFEVVRRLAAEDPTVRFVTAGAALASERAVVSRDLPERMGIADRGVQLGQRSDMPRVYAAMDVLLFPSYREACPRTPMEAAAMGRPVVASDLRGCRWSVRDGVNGFVAPVRDVEAFAARVRRLRDDRRLRERMGQAGRALALARFDEERMFERVAVAYRALLAGRPVPSGDDLWGLPPDLEEASPARRADA